MRTSSHTVTASDRRPRPATAVVISLEPRVLAARSRRRRWRARLRALVHHERFAEVLLVGATFVLVGVLLLSLGQAIQLAPRLPPP